MTSSLALGVMVVIAIGFAVNLVRLQGRLWSEGRGLPLEGLAASRGWQYVAEDPTWAAMVTGEPGPAYHIVSGRHRGHPVAAYEHTAASRPERDAGHARVSTFVLIMAVDLPWVAVEPQNPVETAGRVLGGQDIELECEEFNRAYRVRSTDPRFATALLTPRTMEDLLATGVALQTRRSFVVMTTAGPLQRETVVAYLDLLVDIRERVPRFVWTDLGLPAPGDAH